RARGRLARSATRRRWRWRQPAALHRAAALRNGRRQRGLVAVRIALARAAARPGRREQPAGREGVVDLERAEPAGLPAAAALVDQVALSGLAGAPPQPLPAGLPRPRGLGPRHG